MPYYFSPRLLYYIDSQRRREVRPPSFSFPAPTHDLLIAPNVEERINIVRELSISLSLLSACYSLISWGSLNS